MGLVVLLLWVLLVVVVAQRRRHGMQQMTTMPWASRPQRSMLMGVQVVVRVQCLRAHRSVTREPVQQRASLAA